MLRADLVTRISLGRGVTRDFTEAVACVKRQEKLTPFRHYSVRIKGRPVGYARYQDW